MRCCRNYQSQQSEKEATDLLREEKASVEKQVIERTEALSKAKDDISKGWLQIQQEKVRLTASINSLPLGFIMTDVEGNVLTHNPVVTKIFNLITDEWKIAEVFEKIVSKIDLPAHIAKSISDKKQTIINEIQLESKYLRITIVPFDPSSRSNRYCYIGRRYYGSKSSRACTR